jgi:hypothetical protein
VPDSILNTIKQTLGLEADDTSFDIDVLLFTNSVFSHLTQIGVGPTDGFQIEDSSVTWDAFLANDKRINNVKAFVHLKVRLLFDPPATSFAIAAMEAQAKEIEFRIYTVKEVDAWVASLS